MAPTLGFPAAGMGSEPTARKPSIAWCAIGRSAEMDKRACERSDNNRNKLHHLGRPCRISGRTCPQTGAKIDALFIAPRLGGAEKRCCKLACDTDPLWRTR